MVRRYVFLRILITLLLVGLLAAGGAALYRFGWAQGYQAGALVAAGSTAGQGSQAAPPAPYYYPYAPWFYGRPFIGPGFGFFPFFPLFGLGFFLILFFLVGGLFRMWGYRRWYGGPGPGYWHHEGERPVTPSEKQEDRPEGK